VSRDAIGRAEEDSQGKCGLQTKDRNLSRGQALPSSSPPRKKILTKVKGSFCFLGRYEEWQGAAGSGGARTKRGERKNIAAAIFGS